MRTSYESHAIDQNMLNTSHCEIVSFERYLDFNYISPFNDTEKSFRNEMTHFGNNLSPKNYNRSAPVQFMKGNAYFESCHIPNCDEKIDTALKDSVSK